MIKFIHSRFGLMTTTPLIGSVPSNLHVGLPRRMRWMIFLFAQSSHWICLLVRARNPRMSPQAGYPRATLNWTWKSGNALGTNLPQKWVVSERDVAHRSIIYWKEKKTISSLPMILSNTMTKWNDPWLSISLSMLKSELFTCVYLVIWYPVLK